MLQSLSPEFIQGKFLPSGSTPTSILWENDVVSLMANTLKATLHVGTESLTIDKGWLNANGRCYWTNGVYDAVYFDTP